MTKATATAVFAALVGGSLPVAMVDGLQTKTYFSESVSESAVRAILNPLEWTTATIEVVGTTDSDPYPQYLNITRHDSLLRHSLGTVVPEETDSMIEYAIALGGD